jgi:hypothetical protein
MRFAISALAVVLLAITSARAEQRREVGAFRLGATAEEIEDAAPRDCWEQEVYYFCDAGSYMVLYTPGGLSWTITFAWEYSGPLDTVAERVGSEYRVELTRSPALEVYAGATDGVRVTLARVGSDTRLTITDTELTPDHTAHTDHEMPE